MFLKSITISGRTYSNIKGVIEESSKFSFVPKCLKIVPSATPAIFAISLVDVFEYPFLANKSMLVYNIFFLLAVIVLFSKISFLYESKIEYCI